MTVGWLRELASSPWFYVGIAATAVLSIAISRHRRRRFVDKSKFSQGRCPAALLADPVTCLSDAVAEVSLLINSGAVCHPAEIVSLLRGTKAVKQIVLVPAALDAIQDLLSAKPSMRADERQLWNDVLNKSRWLNALDARRKAKFSDENPSDVALLEQLWSLAGLTGSFERRSEQWNAIGFQGLDPSTDFRGGGLLALDHIVSFAEHHNAVLKEMMAFNKVQQDDGETSWYLTAVVSIQFTVQLLSQRDHPFHLKQLRTLYGCGNEKKNETEGGSGSALDGITVLHHELMLHFKKEWERDLPHVMEYNQYMPKVYGAFFSP